MTSAIETRFRLMKSHIKTGQHVIGRQKLDRYALSARDSTDVVVADLLRSYVSMLGRGAYPRCGAQLETYPYVLRARDAKHSHNDADELLGPFKLAEAAGRVTHL